MPRLVEEVLDNWRAAERLLDELPPVDPDQESMALAIASLRSLYLELTERSALAKSKLATTDDVLTRSQALVTQVAARLESSAARKGHAPGSGSQPPEP